MARAAEPTRYFFMHVQKTGGTSLYWALRRSLDPAIMYPNASDGGKVVRAMSVDHLLQRWLVRRDEIRLVWGHFPLCTASLLDAPFMTFTVLRDPLERTMSFLRYHQREYPDDRDKSFEEIYENPFVYEGFVHNHMVKMLALDVSELARANAFTTGIRFTPDHLARAKERLAAMDLVGLQEHYDDFWTEFERRSGWDLGEPPHANRTDPVPVSAALRARIVEDNADDFELYEFARDHVAQSTRA
jgi:hypothetical protein